MMHGKAIWKLGIAEIAKASKGFALEPHKTQSFLKNGGQQKWLDKALSYVSPCCNSLSAK